jgi:hypothetical protein
MTVRMIGAHPRRTAETEASVLAMCIEECASCAQACVACTDACLSEPDVRDLVRCASLNLDCADLCDATARILARQSALESSLARSVVLACAEACRLCGDECDRHSDHEHCRICAEACKRCEQACTELLASLPSR